MLNFSWICGKLIGAGSFGNVVFGLNKDTGEVMAVKQVPIVDLTEENILEKIKALEVEIELLSQLEHKNIVRYIGSSREQEFLNIFLEYEGSGSIAKLISKYGKFQENLVRIYSKQILEGLEFLHAHNVVHRDIKGANVLVDSNGICKLADFGGAKRIYAGASGEIALLTSLKGTPYWMAPEVIRQTGHGRKADIWSFGCTVIEMATGKPPWSNKKNQFAAMFHIGNTTQPPEFPEDFSEEGKDFLGKILKINPNERSNVRTLLNHPFIVNEFAQKEDLSELNKDKKLRKGTIVQKQTSIQ
jgi:serine/threonine protein kinase